MAALHGDHSQGPLHACVYHPQDGGGGGRDVAAEGRRQVADGRVGEVRAHVHAAAQEVLRRDASQHYLGVGDCGVATASVEGGAGVRTRALGADAQGAPGVDAGDGAAAGTHAEHVDAGAADRQLAHMRLISLPDTTGAERDVGGGAAHIERDDAVEAGGGGYLERAGNASGGAGERRAHGQAPGGLRAHAAAAGAHDPQAGDALLPQLRLQPGQVAGDDGSDVGVGDCGGCALILTVLGQDFVGGRNEQLAFAGGLGDQTLVLRIEEGEQEADRQRLHALRLKLVQEALHPRRVQALEHLSVGVQPLVRLQPQLVRHQGRRPPRRQIVEAGARLAADDEEITEAVGGDERGLGALTLDDGVGGHGGAVGYVFGPGGHLAQPLQDAARRVVGCGGPLVDADATVLPEEEVGKGAAGVDTQDGGHD